MILVSKFMVHRALSDKAYLSLGLLSPLILEIHFGYIILPQQINLCGMGREGAVYWNHLVGRVVGLSHLTLILNLCCKLLYLLIFEESK